MPRTAHPGALDGTSHTSQLHVTPGLLTFGCKSQTRRVWDCHTNADQARGGARGVNGATYMVVPWSVWE